MTGDRVPNYELDSVVTDSNALTTEVQRITITGAAAGSGEFTITFDGETTDPLANDANSAVIQAAVDALSNIDAGDVTVVRTGDVIKLTFSRTGQYAQQSVPEVTVTEDELEDDEEEAIVAVVATTVAGGEPTNAVKRGTGGADATERVSPLEGNSPIEERAANSGDYD